MTKRVLVPVSDGFEEIETVTIIDILRRAGASVVMAGVDGSRVTGRSDITMLADMDLDTALSEGVYDLIALPGGLPNAYTLRDDQRVIDAVAAQAAQGRLVAAICAAPVALERAGLLAGRRATSFPAMEAELSSAEYTTEPVVVAGNIITSRAAGTAMGFALALVRELFGEAKAAEIGTSVLAQV